MTCIAFGEDLTTLRMIEDFSKQRDDITISCINNCVEAETIIDKGVETIFLDIEKTGYDFLELPSGLLNNCSIIIISDKHQDAYKAFEIEAVDFLLKPFNYERFNKAIDKALLKQKILKLTEPKELINVRYKYRKVPVNLSDILYLKAMENYTKIYLKDRKMVLAHNSLKQIEGELPASHFIRIHRSYIVPIREIFSISVQNITLINGEIIPVGKRYARQLNITGKIAIK